MKTRWIAFAVSVALVTGCASNIQLDKPPIEDKTAAKTEGNQSASKTGASTDQNNQATSAIKQVQANDEFKPGAAPANVIKVVYFDHDSFQIRPEFIAPLEAHARWLNANRKRRLAIEGHTDASGGSEYNLALGQRRADAVTRALMLLGVTEPQVESISFGEEKPADPGTDEAAMAKNRRVELYYR